MLTFIEGEVAGDPRPAWVADETRPASVGRLVRAYDDAAYAAFARMWADGVGDAIKRREAWLDRHGAAIEAALTA